MKYFAGLDGGGSKTELLISDSCGRIICHTVGDCSNYISTNIAKASYNVEYLLEKSLACFNIEDIAFMSVCIPGIHQYCSNVKIINELLKQNKAEVSGDEGSAFTGALAGSIGIVILSGTGSFAAGLNKSGQRAAAGGWGPLLGDEGSGYFMGIKAIKAVISQFEYFGPETILTPMVLEHFKINRVNELKSIVYKNGINTKEIASMSYEVLKGAQYKDNVCLNIIEESARYLSELAGIIIKKLQMDDGNYNLCLTGGIRNFGNLLTDPLQKFIAEKYTNISMIEPYFEPVVGSLILSLKKDGINIDDTILNNLKKTYKEVDRNVIEPVL